MIITCPECDARFVLPEKALGPEGRRLRCGQCRHIWYKVPPKNEPEDVKQLEAARDALRKQAEKAVKQTSGQKVYLPALQTPARFAHEWAIFSICFIVLIAATLYLFGPTIIYKYPFTQPVYETFGIVPTEGVKLYDTKIEKIKQYGQDSLSVSGVIANESEFIRYVPNLQIIQQNSAGAVLDKSVLASGFPELAPGAETDYRNIIPIVSTEVTQVVIDIGDVITLRRRVSE